MHAEESSGGSIWRYEDVSESPRLQGIGYRSRHLSQLSLEPNRLILVSPSTSFTSMFTTPPSLLLFNIIL